MAGFSVAELYIRWFLPIDEEGRYELTDDPILFYRLAVDVSGFDLGARYSQTRQHTRGPLEFTHDPKPGVERILWVGDSACYGVRVADEQTAPYQLQQVANSHGAAVESINLGVVGYNVRQVREVIKQRSKEFSGARAIVYFHHENDIVNATWVALAPHIPSGLHTFERPQSQWKKLLKRSALIHRLGRTRLVGSLLGIAPPDLQQISNSTGSVAINPFSRLCLSLYNEDDPLGRQFREELFAMADKAEQLGARFYVVFWPTPTVGGHKELEQARRTFQKWCSSRGIEFLDVTDDFLAGTPDGLYSDTSHPGARGHRIVAEAVWKAYRQLPARAGESAN